MDQDGQKRFLRVIDLGVCIGCGACEAVCDFLHDGKPFIKVYRTATGLDIPLSCFHCSKAPCIEVCPTGAMTRDPSGAVYVEKNRCIGCLACLYACPFSIPELDPVLKVSSKCDLCQPLRSRGLQPGCVSICPAGAILYGVEETVYEAGKKRVAEAMARARFESLGYR
ncbi:4Fe-4S dicluster domain-containing protein [Thermogladius sp. 4427co]|uniref:4Fe-4S dicluster domain-containing protein n=1 Tax=Thermogladius sp. 4427co TaxID=3450718 RepID=UPI003F7AF578